MEFPLMSGDSGAAAARISSASTRKRPASGSPLTETRAPAARSDCPSGRTSSTGRPRSGTSRTSRSDRPAAKSSAVRISIVPDRVSEAETSSGLIVARRKKAAARRLRRQLSLMECPPMDISVETGHRPRNWPNGQVSEGAATRPGRRGGPHRVSAARRPRADARLPTVSPGDARPAPRHQPSASAAVHSAPSPLAIVASAA